MGSILEAIYRDGEPVYQMGDERKMGNKLDGSHR